MARKILLRDMKNSNFWETASDIVTVTTELVKCKKMRFFVRSRNFRKKAHVRIQMIIGKTFDS